MKCPTCGRATEVVDSRRVKIGVRRTRTCNSGHRFNTTEIVGSAPDIERLLKAADQLADAACRRI